MSKRSNWCDYDKNTRKYIKKEMAISAFYAEQKERYK